MIPNHVDLLLLGGTVLAEDGETLIPDAAVMVVKDRIAAIAPREAVRGLTASRTIDCADGLIIPGFVDCHVHTCQQLSRGLADEVDADEWMRRIVWFEAVMTEADVAVSARAACLEMIRAGITGFIEACANPLYVDAVGGAIRDSGLRGVLTRSTIERSEGSWQWELPAPMVMSRDANLTATRAMIEMWNGAADGRITAWPGWRHLANLSDELIIDLVHLAHEHEVGVHGHVGVQDTGETTRLDNLGLLWSDMVFAHGFKMTPRDLDLVQEHDIKISHNPAASVHGAYGASVVGQIPEMISRGVCVCLGSDSASGGNRLDVLRQAYLAAVIHKEARQDASCVPAATAFRMATRNGARAMKLADGGRLSPGAKADIAVLDLSAPHLIPSHNLINNIVYAGSAQDVDTTIVNGTVLMEHRRVLSLDEPSVLRDAAAHAAEIAERWRKKLKSEFPGMQLGRV